MQADVIIVGSGISALQLACHLQEEKKVILITKGHLKDSNSYRAQGGIAAALHHEDRISFHIKDTMAASVDFANETVVRELISEGHAVIKEFVEQGFPFDVSDAGDLHFGMEGAHQKRRILHSNGDQTGKAFINYLYKKLNSNVIIREHETVYEAIINEAGECIGVKSKDHKNDSHVYLASATVLATGGCSAIYHPTSNHRGAIGDGLFVAWKAGAKLVNCEFIQFHPTVLNVKNFTSFLISEAVRGEGGILVLKDGSPLMKNKHPMGDLAPRHIVAKAIYDAGEVYLDIRHIQSFEKKFPSISKACEERGIPILKGIIPVQPGAHFVMGGVETDSYGRTKVKGLYAIGELAYTGLHGANRLASNSLLEGLVIGKRVAEDILMLEKFLKHNYTIEEGIPYSAEISFPSCQELRENMMKWVGIERSRESLEAMLQWIQPYCEDFSNIDMEALSYDQIHTLFMLFSATTITRSALMREETRGAHMRSDFPNTHEEWRLKQIVHERNKVYTEMRDYEFAIR